MTKVYFKGFLNALLFTLISMHSLAQLAPGQKWNEFMGDSLLGFDESELRSFAYGENLSVQATNSYLYNQKRFFIYQKYFNSIFLIITKKITIRMQQNGILRPARAFFSQIHLYDSRHLSF